MNPTNESGRCPICGGEDIIEYTDGSGECMECGSAWEGVQYVHKVTSVQKKQKQPTPHLSVGDIIIRLLFVIVCWTIVFLCIFG